MSAAGRPKLIEFVINVMALIAASRYYSRSDLHLVPPVQIHRLHYSLMILKFCFWQHRNCVDQSGGFCRPVLSEHPLFPKVYLARIVSKRRFKTPLLLRLEVLLRGFVTAGSKLSFLHVPARSATLIPSYTPGTSSTVYN